MICLPTEEVVICQVAAVQKTAELGPEGIAALMIEEQRRIGFVPDAGLVAIAKRR